MGIILVMMLIFLIMGMFMDWVGIVLLIMPVFLPIVAAPAGRGDRLLRPRSTPRYIPIWFGVVFCMNMQVSFLSPPFGPAAFYLKSVAPAAHLAHRHLQGLPAVHLPAASGAERCCWHGRP